MTSDQTLTEEEDTLIQGDPWSLVYKYYPYHSERLCICIADHSQE